MRDPKRIAVFIEKLRGYWACLPDWRFGQLMSNFLGYVVEQTKRDIFFIEDDEMLVLLDKFFESVKPL